MASLTPEINTHTTAVIHAVQLPGKSHNKATPAPSNNIPIAIIRKKKYGLGSNSPCQN